MESLSNVAVVTVPFPAQGQGRSPEPAVDPSLLLAALAIP
jgi:hypothetical protein